MLDFTVAIPTYNGAARLPLVLAALAAQRGTESLTWEIWVIDNNSRDTTAQVVQDYQAQWPCSYPLHYGHEARQGLAYARQRAIELAAGCYVAFLDDDNLPAPDSAAAFAAATRWSPPPTSAALPNSWPSGITVPRPAASGPSTCNCPRGPVSSCGGRLGWRPFPGTWRSPATKASSSLGAKTTKPSCTSTAPAGKSGTTPP